MFSSLTIVIPILGAIAIALWPNLSSQTARRLALTFASAVAAIVLAMATQFDPAAIAPQWSTAIDWLPKLGLTYSVGVDGLSLPVLGLSALVLWVALWASPSQNLHRPRLYYALLLLAGAGLNGAFLAQNLLLFILFYELELIPFYLLIAIWGSPDRKGYAATKFLIFTALSGSFVLVSFLCATWLSGAENFDRAGLDFSHLPLTAQLICLGLLLLGFGIKLPLIPLHSWQPDTYAEASPPVSILLSGAAAKLGAFGLIRYGLGAFPDAWAAIAPGLALVGALGALYGSFNALAQRDLKRTIAYSSIGHMGYFIVALAALTPLSLLGASLQMVAHGLIAALLFYLAGTIESVTGSRDRDALSGLMHPMRGLPATSSLFVLAAMASAGIPGLVGFTAEFAIIQGAFSVYPVMASLCVVASGLTAVYFAIAINRTCFGKLDETPVPYPTVPWLQQVPALVLTVMIFAFGIWPAGLVRWSEPITAGYAAAAAPTVPPETAIATLAPATEAPTLP
ncbi:MAG: NADH-quinone oxidoreductase subunit M [Cyanobacteria bacterium]|nr:NADH-quinone oxidoreductase subunit M [Cyanobacteriota bacterium]